MIRSIIALLLGAFTAVAVAQTTALPAEVQPIRDALRAADFDRATDLGEALVEAQPENARAWQWLARAYAQKALRAGLLSKASLAGDCREAYERSVALDPAHAETQFELLEYYVAAPGIVGGGEDKARAQAEVLAKLNPAYGHIALGMLAQKFDEDEAAAEREFRAAVAAGGDMLRARSALANFLVARERWSEARAVWAEALATDPADPTALYATGRIAALSGESLEEGLAALDRYLALEDEDKPGELGTAPAHWRRGLVLEKLGRTEDAIAALTTAVATDASFTQAKQDLERLQ